MNRKHVKSEMDSGLGSDEDRRGRTKEQKQLHNQQLLSGCFIDAASLSDDAEVVDQRRSDERRQGALIFQNSLPHFSMLQMTNAPEDRSYSCSSGNLNSFPDTSTPYNSIVQLDVEEASASVKSPLGFYVDLSNVEETQDAPPSASTTKNIFSMVIDFEGPKKDKPMKLSSSFISHRRPKPTNKNLITKANGSSLSSSYSSINSGSVAGTSRQSEDGDSKLNGKSVSIEVLSASLVKNLSISSKSSSSTENIVRTQEELDRDSAKDSVEEEHIECDVSEKNEGCDVIKELGLRTDGAKGDSQGGNRKLEPLPCPQFVKLSDLECQKPRTELNFTPRMSRSIPESSWVEGPLLMSHSVGYRSAPKPLEPERHESTPSDSMEGMQTSANEPPKKMERKLGTDLLRMFLEEIGPDVVVEVEGHRLKAHKCILASRCQYFAALLSGNWLEKSGNVISLQGFSYESVYFALCHVYSGAAHVPDSISLVELASLADMLGLEGLKEVVERHLRRRHCHDFHSPPCAGCLAGVLEALPVAAAYGLDDLYRQCVRWTAKHFERAWPSRAFASLPRELRDRCYRRRAAEIGPETVMETALACDKILATLPSMRWAEPVSQLVLQLTDACHLYLRQHFSAVLGSQYLVNLDAGLGFGVCQIEDQMLVAAKNLGIEQSCRSYSRCCKMLNQTWSRPFADLLNKIKVQLEQSLVSQADRLIRSNAWLRLDTALRTRIKELTPALEPQSRLPRATPLRNRRSPSTSKPSLHAPISSSDSSRNSSPGIINQQSQGGKLQASNGSPSLRRSLLLAAKAPQVPPSPSMHRKSTLTQPTAASAAKSAAAVKNTRPTARATGPVVANSRQPISNARSATNNMSRSVVSSSKSLVNTTTTRPPVQSSISKSASTSKRSSSAVSRNTSLGKRDAPSTLSARRPDSRSSSPLKSDSRTSSPRKLDSRVTSPNKANVRSPSPMKDSITSPRRVTKAPPQPVVQTTESTKPKMQRSSTFLKEEPTILGKVM